MQSCPQIAWCLGQREQVRLGETARFPGELVPPRETEVGATGTHFSAAVVYLEAASKEKSALTVGSGIPPNFCKLSTTPGPGSTSTHLTVPWVVPEH